MQVSKSSYEMVFLSRFSFSNHLKSSLMASIRHIQHINALLLAEHWRQ